MHRNDSTTKNISSKIDYDDLWIPRFLSTRENAYLERVPDSFILDRFNLHGLKEIVEDFEEAYSVIKNDCHQRNPYEECKLYFLIHQRYITFSKQGMQSVLDRVSSGEYGGCPRYGCNEANVIPTGLSNDFGKSKTKVYCQVCKNIYEPRGSLKRVDGSAWGTSFAQFLIISYPYHFENAIKKRYIPRLFGFYVSRLEEDDDSADDA